MITHRYTSRTRLALLATGALLLAPLALTGCAQNAAPQDDAAASETAATDEVTLSGGWAKANADSEMSDMTGAFGTIENGTDEDLVLESAESDAAGMVELHRTDSDGKMSEDEDGFRIPAGGSFELAPGGDHIMLMGMTEGVSAGDEIAITLHFSDGTSLEAKFLVKDYSGANESYDGGSDDEHAEHAEGEDAHAGHGDGSDHDAH